jgi:hypothetical protein
MKTTIRQYLESAKAPPTAQAFPAGLRSNVEGLARPFLSLPDGVHMEFATMFKLERIRTFVLPFPDKAMGQVRIHAAQQSQ